MRRQDRNILLAVLGSFIIVFAVIMFVASGSKAKDNTDSTTEKTTEQNTEKPTPKGGGREAHFYFFDEGKPGAYNFGPDRYSKAQNAVANNEAEDVLDYIVGTDGSGDLFQSIHRDPALAAATSWYLDSEGATGDSKILPEPKKNQTALDVIREARDRFMADDAEWKTAEVRIIAILTDKDTKVELKTLDNYKSAMYMVEDDQDPTKADVVVRQTSNAGGHFVVFTVKVNGKEIKLKFRLECGYQAIEPQIPVPDKPPVPDNPPDPPTPHEKKDPKNDPQNRDGADQYDFYSKDRKNNDPNTEETTEPESPTEEYEAPEPPTEDPDIGPPLPPPEEDDSKDTKTGSKKGDKDNGKTEKVDDKEYKVTTGDGKDHGDFTTIVEETPEPVMPELKDDGTNTGDLDESAVE